MRGVQHRDAETRPRRKAQFGGIGEMAMQDVGPFGQMRQQVQERFGQGGQSGVQGFPGQIGRGRAFQPQDAQPGSDLLDRFPVIGAKRGIVEQAGQDIDARDLGQVRLRGGGAQDIGDVPARVLGQAIADRRLLDAAPEGDVHHIHRGLVLTCWGQDAGQLRYAITT